MNTFQLGLCTFKWNDVKMKYVCRPFNFYVFPDSQLYDDMNVQFQSYQRLTKRDEVFIRASQKVLNQRSNRRFYTHLGDNSQQLLSQFLEQVDRFFADTKNSNKNEQLILEVKSHALKRQLSRDINAKYRENGNIYVEFKKNSDQFTIKKWWKRNDYSSSSKKAKDSALDSESKINPEAKSEDLIPATSEFKLDAESEQKIQQDQEETKNAQLNEEEEKQIHQQNQIEDLFIREMGFSLVVEELIRAKKPIVGHNMIYDIAYLYNQFIDTLPAKYSDFIAHWNELFPLIYDTKVLSSASEYFGKTGLGYIYEKCLNDQRLKVQFRINFDIQGGFTNYESSGVLAHYHEAAYDAYMTGYAFANIMKYKEVDVPKEERKKHGGSNNNRGNNRGRGGRGGGKQQQQRKEEEAKVLNKEESTPSKIEDQQQIEQITSQVDNLQINNDQLTQQTQIQTQTTEEKKVEEKVWTKVNFEANFSQKFLNKVMFNEYDGCRLYHLDPKRQEDVPKDWSKVAWVEVKEELYEARADEIAQRLGKYGDFALHRDTKQSFFIEFFYYDPTTVPEQTIENFINAVQEKLSDLGFKSIAPYNDANKFRAHNRFEQI
ncbi:caf1 family ribonuclease containing protein [Stylonychia lemnae]|uniref:Caf1 family ribonuclease containing protein n=1 Tax=Stylonychia lemnae TaxID=5949 RepID=A0A078B2X0_STYLE|nr:caf1 family ribonuclease containing protein [Stylonychia lemnae]|eukprot:CDW88814.1 caf1 family ribonuclease containing protein [Stylonychia lemnae]